MFQNSINKHSYMFLFSRSCREKFPIWFLDWWQSFGPNEQILPQNVQEGFQYFTTKFNPSETDKILPPILHFFSKFKLAWIVYWEFIIIPTLPTYSHLGLQFKIKWWDGFDAKSIHPQAIMQWLLKRPHQSQQLP